jgi:hypothetical protein
LEKVIYFSSYIVTKINDASRQNILDQIEQEFKQPLQTDRVAKLGQTETVVEKQATTRGLGLAKDDPQPTMIMMASSKTARLVTTLDLVHRE